MSPLTFKYSAVNKLDINNAGWNLIAKFSQHSGKQLSFKYHIRIDFRFFFSHHQAMKDAMLGYKWGHFRDFFSSVYKNGMLYVLIKVASMLQFESVHTTYIFIIR